MAGDSQDTASLDEPSLDRACREYRHGAAQRKGARRETCIRPVRPGIATRPEIACAYGGSHSVTTSGSRRHGRRRGVCVCLVSIHLMLPKLCNPASCFRTQTKGACGATPLLVGCAHPCCLINSEVLRSETGATPAARPSTAGQDQCRKAQTSSWPPIGLEGICLHSSLSRGRRVGTASLDGVHPAEMHWVPLARQEP
jgi:hypothetical protein